MNTLYGYVRVSSADQNELRQMITMYELNIPKENIFIDKQYGKDFNREQYKKLIKVIGKGDTRYIMSIDRLGRNYNEIKKQTEI